MKISHQYYFQVQLQMVVCTFSSVDFLIYSPKNKGTALLATVMSNKNFIEKNECQIMGTFWKYYISRITKT